MFEFRAGRWRFTKKKDSCAEGFLNACVLQNIIDTLKHLMNFNKIKYIVTSYYFIVLKALLNNSFYKLK